MRTILHIVTRSHPLAKELIALQQTMSDIQLEVVTLENDPAPEVYKALVEKIFNADSIAVS